METQLAIFIASLLSIVPTFGLLTIGTWWYERKMDEKDLNITFIIGIFIGVVVAVAHLFFAVSYNFGAYAVPAAFLLALLEVLIYRVYLNRSKLKGRTDQPFMAFSLALGISGAYLLFVTGQYLVRGTIDVESVLGILLFTIGVPLARSAAAILFSSDRAAGKPLIKALIRPVLLLTLFNLLMLIYLSSAFVIVFSMIGAILGIAAFYFSYRLLALVPDLNEDGSTDDAGA